MLLSIYNPLDYVICYAIFEAGSFDKMFAYKLSYLAFKDMIKIRKNAHNMHNEYEHTSQNNHEMQFNYSNA